MPFLEEKHLDGDFFFNLHKKNQIFFLVLAVRRQRISQWHLFFPLFANKKYWREKNCERQQTKHYGEERKKDPSKEILSPKKI